jgi:hypothetical protein
MPKFYASRRFLQIAAVVLGGFTLAGCADVTSPDEDVEAGRKRSGYLTTSAAVLSNKSIDVKKMYPTLSVAIPTKTTRGDTLIQTFTVDPKVGRLVQFGENSNYIAIPAYTICDRNTAGYGPSEWLKPCTLATSSITFTVKTWKSTVTGRPHADFQPNVRFSPQALLPVSLYFRDPQLVNFSVIEIPYCDANNNCVNEGFSDYLQRTYAAPAIGGGYWVFRALRHFSGYNVTAF